MGGRRDQGRRKGRSTAASRAAAAEERRGRERAAGERARFNAGDTPFGAPARDRMNEKAKIPPKSDLNDLVQAEQSIFK